MDLLPWDVVERASKQFEMWDKAYSALYEKGCSISQCGPVLSQRDWAETVFLDSLFLAGC